MTTHANFVILGHSGFLGQALVRTLKDQGKSHVHGFSSATADLKSSECLRVLEPVVDSQTILIHCSALAPRHGRTIDTFQTNVAIAANVSRLVARKTPAKLVYVSTDGVYPMIEVPVTETTPPNPEDYYAIAKFTAERLLHVTAAEKGVPTLIVRPPAMYGPGDPHHAYGPNRFVRTIVQERRVTLFGGGEERRDHVHVRDVAGAILSLVDANASGVYNLASGQSVSFARVIDHLRALISFPFEVVNNPRKGPITHREYDVAKFRAVCPGFRYRDLQDGLSELVTHTLNERSS